MLKFQLFRIHVTLPDQILWDIPPEQMHRPAIIKKSIAEKPSRAKRVQWSIGNYSEIESDIIYYRVGRLTKAHLGDYIDGNFKDLEQDSAIYTHVMTSPSTGLTAIAYNYKVAPKHKTIANQLVFLLNSTSTIKRYHAKISIKSIKNPVSFIERIRSSYQVTRFGFTFSPSNPLDAHEMLQKPMQKLADSLGGFGGSGHVDGEDLERDTIEVLTESLAATGEDAYALIRNEPRASLEKVSLHENPLIVQGQEPKTKEGIVDLWRSVTRAFQKIVTRE